MIHSREGTDQMGGIGLLTMATRAKVYQRPAEPPRMRITERDVEILKTAAAFRFVSGEQIERLIFTKGEKGERGRTRSPARLRKMFDNGLLGRVRWPFHAITLPMVYYLQQEGADFLTLGLGIDEDRIRTLTKTEKKPVISRSLLFLSHTLAINDFRIGVTLACERKGLALVTWLNEYELGRDYAEIEYEGKRRKQAVQPDGYFVVRDGQTPRHFFLEMDMGTTPPLRWSYKVLGLYEYRFRGKYTERFGTKDLRVLCVTQSESRKNRLIEWTKVAVPERWQFLFWFTTQDRVRVASVLTEPIWEVVGEDAGRRRAVFQPSGG